RAGPFDTQEVPSDANIQDQGLLGAQEPGGLYLVQMRGPIKPEWLQWLRRKARIISYIPNNAYLVRAPSGGLPGLKSWSAGGPDFVQWVGPYKPNYKVSPRLRMDSPHHMEVTVQLAKSSNIDKDLAALEALSDSKMGPVISLPDFVDVPMSAGREALAQISGMRNVLWIEPATETKMFDERQDQIIAGSMAGNQLAPPMYLNWLHSRGLDSPAGFIV